MTQQHVRSFLPVLAGGLFVAASFAALNCGSDEEQAAVSAEKQFFSQKVYPELSRACASCHATGKSGSPIFLSDNAEGSYKAIEGTPGYIAAKTASPIVQKGQHSGPALTSDQEEILTEWLDKEVLARKLDKGSNRPPNLRAAFKAFGECMDYELWMNLKLSEIAKVQTNDGICISCHTNGQGSLKMTTDPAETFRSLSQFPYVQRLVTGTVSPGGSFGGLEPSNRLLQKGTEQRQANANPHPTYELSYIAIGQGAAQEYVNLSENLQLYVRTILGRMAERKCEGTKPPDAGADADAAGP
jgi:hypothetical protein